MRIPTVWGASDAELTARYACDDWQLADGGWFRAVTVDAPPATVFRWLTQLKVAPYSYDLLDNWGRRSPRRLVPGVQRLEVGQRVMTIFELVDFAQDEHITLRLRAPSAVRLFGELAVTYAVRDIGDGRSRLVAKLAVAPPVGPLGRARRAVLAWGDLAMMRRQLLTLKECAESTAPRPQPSGAAGQ